MLKTKLRKQPFHFKENFIYKFSIGNFAFFNSQKKKKKAFTKKVVVLCFKTQSVLCVITRFFWRLTELEVAVSKVFTCKDTT